MMLLLSFIHAHAECIAFEGMFFFIIPFHYMYLRVLARLK